MEKVVLETVRLTMNKILQKFERLKSRRYRPTSCTRKSANKLVDVLVVYPEISASFSTVLQSLPRLNLSCWHISLDELSSLNALLRYTSVPTADLEPSSSADGRSSTVEALVSLFGGQSANSVGLR